MAGFLYIIATPIGHLQDITLRALNILKEVDIVIAEDTRRTFKLFQSYNIKAKKMISCHKYNEKKNAERIVKLILNGKNAAMVTDSGTPGIADPGQYFVRKAREQGIQIFAVPGASALTAAISVAGIEERGFTFTGFLGKKKKDIEKIKVLLNTTGYPVVFYESPKRIVKTIQRIGEIIPESNLILCRELTKIYEEVIEGTPQAVLDIIKQKSKIKGEFVGIIYQKRK